MSNWETVSLFICSALDALGFSEFMVKERRKFFNSIQNILSDANITDGFETLIDQNLSEILMVKNNIICLSQEDIGFKCGKNQTAFVTDRSSSPPGYTRLKLQTHIMENNTEEFENDVILSTFGQPRYLWGNFFYNKMKGKFEQIARQITGPMFHADKDSKEEINFPLILLDTSAVLKVKRKLRSTQITREVCPAEGFVFPDNSSCSDTSYLEWRVSYSRTEQKLFLTLNDTQIKLYILLEMIRKSTLCEISGEINSYVMKNIVFWMIFLCEPELFQERYLIHLLLFALGILYNCVNSGFIPCFMTEERNLLTKPMEVPRKHALLEMLSILQQERACMLLRCEKLKCVMMMKFKSPHIVDMYQRQRDTLETLLLFLETIQANHSTKSKSKVELIRRVFSDEDWLKVAVDVYNLVYPGWEQSYLEGINVQDTVIERIREILN